MTDIPQAGPATQQPAEQGTDPAETSERPAEAGPAPVVVGEDRGARRRVALRALAIALPVGALGSALVLFGMSKAWTHGTAAFGGRGVPVHASGSQTTALPGALALVGLAALVAVFAVRRFGRYAVSGLLALSGAGVIAIVLARRGDHGAVDSAAAGATGLTHATAAHVTTTSWPLVAVVGGVLLLVAGLLAVRYGPDWPAMSSRYDRGGGKQPAPRRAAPAPVDPDRPEDLWKAIDRGEDPTAPAPR